MKLPVGRQPMATFRSHRIYAIVYQNTRVRGISQPQATDVRGWRRINPSNKLRLIQVIRMKVICSNVAGGFGANQRVWPRRRWSIRAHPLGFPSAYKSHREPASQRPWTINSHRDQSINTQFYPSASICLCPAIFNSYPSTTHRPAAKQYHVRRCPSGGADRREAASAHIIGVRRAGVSPIYYHRLITEGKTIGALLRQPVDYSSTSASIHIHSSASTAPSFCLLLSFYRLIMEHRQRRRSHDVELAGGRRTRWPTTPHQRVRHRWLPAGSI